MSEIQNLERSRSKVSEPPASATGEALLISGTAVGALRAWPRGFPVQPPREKSDTEVDRHPHRGPRRSACSSSACCAPSRPWATRTRIKPDLPEFKARTRTQLRAGRTSMSLNADEPLQVGPLGEAQQHGVVRCLRHASVRSPHPRPHPGAAEATIFWNRAASTPPEQENVNSTPPGRRSLNASRLISL